MTAHDEYRLNPPELDGIICPQCKGDNADCDLCLGDGEVPPLLSGMFKAELNSE